MEQLCLSQRTRERNLLQTKINQKKYKRELTQNGFFDTTGIAREAHVGSYGEQPTISLGVGEPARAQRRVQNLFEYNFFDQIQHNQPGIGIRV